MLWRLLGLPINEQGLVNYLGSCFLSHQSKSYPIVSAHPKDFYLIVLIFDDLMKTWSQYLTTFEQWETLKLYNINNNTHYIYTTTFSIILTSWYSSNPSGIISDKCFKNQQMQKGRKGEKRKLLSSTKIADKWTNRYKDNQLVLIAQSALKIYFLAKVNYNNFYNSRSLLIVNRLVQIFCRSINRALLQENLEGMNSFIYNYYIILYFTLS